jgi:hypothetical protein
MSSGDAFRAGAPLATSDDLGGETVEVMHVPWPDGTVKVLRATGEVVATNTARLHGTNPAGVALVGR